MGKEKVISTDGDHFKFLRRIEKNAFKADEDDLELLQKYEEEAKEAVIDFQDRFNELTTKMLNRFKKSHETKNIVLSPASIIMLLAMLADAVYGDSRDEVLNVLGEYISYEDSLIIVEGLINAFSRSESVKISNAVCVNEGIKEAIVPEYSKSLQESFNGELFCSSDMVNDVNNWVKDATNGLIDKIVDDSMRNALVCLMNAIAFESDWAETYDEEQILEDDFTNLDGTVSKVNYLMSDENLYVEDSNFTGFLKPYKDSNYVFMGLLPKKNSYLKKNISDIDFSALYCDADAVDVSATMPEFKFELEESLVDFCKNLGIKRAFTPNADFSPLASKPLMVTDIKHKATIQVDRKGTVAAAATWAEIEVGCAPMEWPEIKEVCLDRPFVYAIMNKETELPVFAGIYNYGSKINS